MPTSPGLVRVLAVAASAALSLSLIQVLTVQDVALRSATSPGAASPSPAPSGLVPPGSASSGSGLPGSSPSGSSSALAAAPGVAPTPGASAPGAVPAPSPAVSPGSPGGDPAAGVVPGQAVPGQAVPAQPAPGPAVPGQAVPGNGVPQEPGGPSASPGLAQPTPEASGTPSPSPSATTSPAPSPRWTLRLSDFQRALVRSVPAGRAYAHLKEFQRIADENGGTRAAGTPGYTASRDYVAKKLRKAGYRVRLQPFEFGFYRENSTALMERIAPTRAVYTPTPPDNSTLGDFATMTYSGSGEVTAPVHAVDLVLPPSADRPSTSGCELTDFAGFPRGGIALIQRGTCGFALKVSNAQASGAAAVIVFNEGTPDHTELLRGSLGGPGVTIPVVGTTYALGAALAGTRGAVIHLRTDTTSETRVTHNVIADSRWGERTKVVMAGAHLDSVLAGPGINDNGSGSAALLAAAESLGRIRTRNHLRLVWWGAEELGLIGSRHYMDELSPRERGRIRLYLNFDMVASSNGVMMVYDGVTSTAGEVPPGSAEIEGLFRAFLDARRQPYWSADLSGRSDYAPFMEAGVPVGGLFTGAGEKKTEEEANRYGGLAGRPYDPCYHRNCDTIANIDRRLLTIATKGIATALVVYAYGNDLPGPDD